MPRVLIIEDNRLDNQLLAGELEKLGLETTSAYTGGNAIGIIRESLRSQQHFDIILTDGQVHSGPTGAEIIRYLRDEEPYKTTPILASSGDSSMWDGLKDDKNLQTQEKTYFAPDYTPRWDIPAAVKKVKKLLPTLQASA